MSKNMLGVALREILGPLVDFFTKLMGDDGEIWWETFKRFLRKEPCWAKDQVAQVTESKRSILRRIEGATGLALPATKGKRLLSQQKDLFPGWIDFDFTDYGCDVVGEARPETLVDVYEQVEDATFEQMFEGRDKSQFCLTQDQIASFVENHRKHLHPKGYPTSFLFKVKIEVEGEMKDHFFVADVRWSGAARRLGVDVCRFSSGRVWSASYRSRFVLPQLAL